FAIAHAADIDTRFADQIAAEFDDQRRFRQFARSARRECREILTDGFEIEPPLAGEIGNAEAAADVEYAHRRRGILRQTQRKFVGVALRVADRFGLEALRSPEKMKAFEGEPRLADATEQF